MLLFFFPLQLKKGGLNRRKSRSHDKSETSPTATRHDVIQRSRRQTRGGPEPRALHGRRRRSLPLPTCPPPLTPCWVTSGRSPTRASPVQRAGPGSRSPADPRGCAGRCKLTAALRTPSGRRALGPPRAGPGRSPPRRGRQADARDASVPGGPSHISREPRGDQPPLPDLAAPRPGPPHPFPSAPRRSPTRRPGLPVPRHHMGERESGAGRSGERGGATPTHELAHIRRRSVEAHGRPLAPPRARDRRCPPLPLPALSGVRPAVRQRPPAAAKGGREGPGVDPGTTGARIQPRLGMAAAAFGPEVTAEGQEPLLSPGEAAEEQSR